MTISLPLTVAGPELEQWMKRLYPGDTITLTNSDGLPLAVVVPLTPMTGPDIVTTDWNTQWDRLAQAVSQAWPSDQSAVEILGEMRR